MSFGVCLGRRTGLSGLLYEMACCAEFFKMIMGFTMERGCGLVSKFLLVNASLDWFYGEHCCFRSFHLDDRAMGSFSATQIQRYLDRFVTS